MKITQINEWVALKITLAVSTMYCVYAFAVMTSIPFFFPHMTETIQFISSSFLQLIFLPLILVGTNIMGRAAEERAQADHEMLMEEVAILKQLLAEAAEERAVIAKLTILMSEQVQTD